MGLDRLADFGKSIIDFERTNLRDIGDKIKKDPERLFLGAADEFGGELWGKILGKDYEPMVNRWGGPDASAWQRAEAKGIDLGPNELMHGIAETVASMYAANYGADQVRAFGQSQGWNPDYVDKGIQAAEQGIGQAQSSGQEEIGSELLMPHTGGGRDFAPPPADTFGLAPPMVQTASGAPPSGQVPGAIPTFHQPMPTPPAQPGTRRR